MIKLEGRAQWSEVMAALRVRTLKGSSPARFFFFERCQTTPGYPFSGTSGSPV